MSSLRQPALFMVEVGLLDRLTLEMGAGDRGTLGVRAMLAQSSSGRFQFVGGLTDLVTSGEDHLSGRQSPVGEGSRLWARSLWGSRWVDASGGIAARLSEGSVEIIPSVAVKGHITAFLPLSLGWEGQYEEESLRQSLGFGVAWKSLSLGIGFTELQSWIMQKGETGWFGSPPAGARDGRDNPGIWMRASWTIPAAFTNAGAAPGGAARGRRISAEQADSAQVALVDEALTRRSTRRDLAELAVTDQDNPGHRAMLRRQILSGGETARLELWRVALSNQFLREERLQAIATLDIVLCEEDAGMLANLAKDPEALIRQSATRELLRLDNPLARETLEMLAKDPDPAVRNTAALRSQAPQPSAPANP
ncbi:MAG: hypothetical protein RL318_2429 [Fibrobacterota bacterium]|jgi:hypothetical protein